MVFDSSFCHLLQMNLFLYSLLFSKHYLFEKKTVLLEKNNETGIRRFFKKSMILSLHKAKLFSEYPRTFHASLQPSWMCHTLEGQFKRS
jgi:hypothetical protein